MKLSYLNIFTFSFDCIFDYSYNSFFLFEIKNIHWKMTPICPIVSPWTPIWALFIHFWFWARHVFPACFKITNTCANIHVGIVDLLGKFLPDLLAWSTCITVVYHGLSIFHNVLIYSNLYQFVAILRNLYWFYIKHNWFYIKMY